MSLDVLPVLVLGGAALLMGVLWLRGRRERGRLEGERARLEQEVAQLRQDLNRADEAREAFFDLVTHELRSPLSAILGYQELLADGAYGALESAAEPVERIGRSARHLLHLIDGVVEISRIRAGTARPDTDEVNLGVLLSATADAFRTAARERGLEPEVHMPDSLPTIRSDQERLVRALDLLVTSAVKYPAGPSIALHVTSDQHGATLSIRETEIDARVETDDPTLRLGLRLEVARGLAELLDGDLHLDSDAHGIIHAISFSIRDLRRRP